MPEKVLNNYTLTVCEFHQKMENVTKNINIQIRFGDFLAGGLV